MGFLDALVELVGPSGVVAADNVEQFVVDWTGKFRGAPLAVIRPDSTEQVAAVVALCHHHKIGVVPQGGNTGLCGGSVPLIADDPDARDSIVLSLSRMNQIVTIDVGQSTATVEAGVSIEALQEAAATAGLLFAPDWGARGSAQVGGGIATNAGGLNVLRWGSMRSQILGLEVVLPDGRVWDGLRSLRKDSTGLDLKQLFVGTEGTLGIVTKAVFGLHPLPSVHQTAFVSLPSLEHLLPFFHLAQAESAGVVSAFELLPEEGVRRVLHNQPTAQRPLTEVAEWYVLLRLSGGLETADTLDAVLAAAADAGVVANAVIAATAMQTTNLWLLRDELPSLFTFDERGNRHKFDISIPLDAIVRFFEEAAQVVAATLPGALTYGFGHVGDGNLHFNVYPGPTCDVDEFDRLGPELESAVDQLTWKYHGSVSAEHGVGQAMRHRVAEQKSTVELDLLRTIKSALDPGGIMNPGKVLPPP